MAALRPRTASASRSDPFFRAGNFCYRDCAGEPQKAPGGRRSQNTERQEAWSCAPSRSAACRAAFCGQVLRRCVAALLLLLLLLRPRCDSCCKGTTGLEWATRARLLSTRQVAASLLQLSASTFQPSSLPAFRPFLTPAASRHLLQQHTLHLAPIHPSIHPPTQPCPPGPIIVVVVQPCTLPSSLSHACAPCPLLPRPWPVSPSWSICCERTIAL
jgi:hypothetical protein